MTLLTCDVRQPQRNGGSGAGDSNVDTLRGASRADSDYTVASEFNAGSDWTNKLLRSSCDPKLTQYRPQREFLGFGSRDESIAVA
jgi:hypothetical protein